MPPFLGGGEMIADVVLRPFHLRRLAPISLRRVLPPLGKPLPWGAAVDYLSGIGMDKIADAEHELTAYLYEQMQAIPEVKAVRSPT